MRRVLPGGRRGVIALTAAFLLGAATILAVRFATYTPQSTHYHANFAVYLTGERYAFTKPTYYESVSVCSATTAVTTPQQRAHMHDHVDGLIHVHDHAVTWGQFFANLGWTVTGRDIITDDGTLYQADATHPITFILNGSTVLDPAAFTNTVIGDKDRLLVSYGTTDQTQLDRQYASVPSSAAAADTSKDPASCGGSEAPTVGDRLAHLF